MPKQKGERLIANNKKAYFDYFIDEKFEAGIALHGTEVKSLRLGHCSIKAQPIQNQSLLTAYPHELLSPKPSAPLYKFFHILYLQAT